MGIIRNVRSVFPIPKDWERDNDRKAFAIRVETALRELFTKVSTFRNIRIKAGTNEVQPDSDGFIQLGTAATRYVQNNLSTVGDNYVLDARQGKILNDKFADYFLTANIANNLTTETEGKALDARQGKALKDAVDGKLNFVQLASVPSNSSKQYTVNNTGKFLVACFGASTSKQLFLVNVANGTPTSMAFGSGSVLTMSASANTITIANGGNNGAQVYAIILSGTITDKT